VNCFFTKTLSGTLAPADSETAAYVARLKFGQGLRAEVKRARNILFHRRMFALLNFAFDLWDCPALEYQGQAVAKNFDRFRKDITILAGFFDAVTNLRGEVRLEAKSLAFHNMGEEEFERVYKAVLGVVWDRILRSKGYESPEKVDAIVQELLRFE
jgi:predicted nucleotide-binding protein (sugar kinase/HSP70/actin superfamily)